MVDDFGIEKFEIIFKHTFIDSMGKEHELIEPKRIGISWSHTEEMYDKSLILDGIGAEFIVFMNKYIGELRNEMEKADQ